MFSGETHVLHKTLAEWLPSFAQRRTSHIQKAQKGTAMIKPDGNMAIRGQCTARPGEAAEVLR